MSPFSARARPQGATLLPCSCRKSLSILVPFRTKYPSLPWEMMRMVERLTFFASRAEICAIASIPGESLTTSAFSGNCATIISACGTDGSMKTISDRAWTLPNATPFNTKTTMHNTHAKQLIISFLHILPP